MEIQQVLWEGTIDKKFQRKYITEAKLELITAAPVDEAGV
jgi:hypothetical protein